MVEVTVKAAIAAETSNACTAELITAETPEASTAETGRLLGAPLVVGMMQYAHGWLHPVCTRRVNAVRPATPGSIAAPQLPGPSPKRIALV